MNSEYSVQPIGSIRTPFLEKFGVPRQSLMTPSAKGELILPRTPEWTASVQHLERFSHLWLVFWFDRSHADWTPTIEPPRIDAPPRVGVFASRSPDRPNPIGLSVVRLDGIDLHHPDGISIQVSGVDLLDQTPILDIKPYVPYADCITDANSGWIQNDIERYTVEWGLDTTSAGLLTNEFKTLAEEVLTWDPRPRSQRESMPIHAPEHEGREFRFRLSRFDIHWKIALGRIRVIRLAPLD